MPLDRQIPRAQLREPAEPIRLAMDEEALADLADSLRQLGVLEPLLVKLDAPPNGSAPATPFAERVDAALAAGESFEIVDGHRRYMAAAQTSLTSLPCRVFAPDELEANAAMLHANIMREDLTAAEEGWQFCELAEKHGWTMDDLRRKFRRSEEYINARVDLVRKAPEVAKAVAERRISYSVGRRLLQCSDPDHRAYFVEQLATHGGSARTAQYYVDQWKSELLAAQGQPAVHTPQIIVAPRPTDEQLCLWCKDREDLGNMAQVNVHSYHLRDLQKYLDTAREGDVLKPPAS